MDLVARLRTGDPSALSEAASFTKAARTDLLRTLRSGGGDLSGCFALIAKYAVDSDSTISYWSITTLADAITASPWQIRSLLACLTHPDPEIRRGARAGLAQMGWKGMDLREALPPLIGSTEVDSSTGIVLMSEALRQNDSALAKQALQMKEGKLVHGALLRFNQATPQARPFEPDLTPVLDGLLRHSSKNVREEAALALARAATRSGDSGRLLELVQHRFPDVRLRSTYAIRVLAEADQPIGTFFPMLIAGLEQSDSATRMMAAHALGAAIKAGASGDTSAARAALENGCAHTDPRTAAACRSALGKA